MDFTSFILRNCFDVLKFRQQRARHEKRMDKRLQRELRRKTLQKCFDAIRYQTHKSYIAKLEYKQHEFRAELEAKILIQHQNKVDSLLLYAAELEDKIKMEQDAREQMT